MPSIAWTVASTPGSSDPGNSSLLSPAQVLTPLR